MPEPTKPTQLDLPALKSEFSKVRKEVSVPGYWRSLADNCTQWAGEVTVSPYWKQVKERLGQWRAQYRQEHSADLLVTYDLPSFQSKSERSIADKLLRQCRENREQIKSIFSPDGAPIPALNDLVRTRVVCQYIDGVEFISNKLDDLAKEMKILRARSREGRLEGYFAQHINVTVDVIYRSGGEQILAKIPCEIQVASVLSTRMWETTHGIYEFSRTKQQNAEDWQWNPDDPQFIAHQLGHMVHLTDGLLIQLRRSSNAGSKTDEA